MIVVEATQSIFNKHVEEEVFSTIDDRATNKTSTPYIFINLLDHIGAVIPNREK